VKTHYASVRVNFTISEIHSVKPPVVGLKQQ